MPLFYLISILISPAMISGISGLTFSIAGAMYGLDCTLLRIVRRPPDRDRRRLVTTPPRSSTDGACAFPRASGPMTVLLVRLS